MKNIHVILGRRIREVRQIKGLTIQALAEDVNLDPSFLGQIERGVGIPSLNTTHVSIEEIASKIFDRFGIERTMF